MLLNGPVSHDVEAQLDLFIRKHSPTQAKQLFAHYIGALPRIRFFSIQKCCSLTRCATRSTGLDTRVHATHQAQGGGADQNAVWDEDFCGLRPAQRFSLRVARVRFMLQNKPLRLRGGKERFSSREADAPNHC